MKEPISPMLATLVHEPISRAGWINEEKYDGYRALAYRRGKRVRLYSRSGKDVSKDFPEVVKALGELPDDDLVLDGEIVAFDSGGVSRFQLLQRREMKEKVEPVFAVFDCLRREGRDRMNEPLSKRRKGVEMLVPSKGRFLMRARRIESDGRAAYRTAKKNGWEGVIAKDDSSPYRPGQRSRSWLKVKVRHESEFVIGGFTDPAGSRKHFGALLVGLYDGGRLRFCGKVGTGFSDSTLADLGRRMRKIESTSSPFDPTPKESANWIEPRLVAQIVFAEWTKGGRLRQPAYLGLRTDKDPNGCLWKDRE